MSGQRVGDRLRAAARDRPAHRMGEQREHEAERRRDRAARAGASSARHSRRTAPARAARGSASGPGRWRSARALSPKRANGTGCRGGRSGPSSAGRSLPASRASGPMSFVYARPSAPPIDAAVASSERSSTTAVPSSSGCASATSGCRSSRPWPASGSVRRNGDPATSGWTAEQTSCRYPGSVSSRGARAAPERGRALEHQHRASGGRQRDRRRQAVRAGAHHHGVVAGLSPAP